MTGISTFAIIEESNNAINFGLVDSKNRGGALNLPAPPAIMLNHASSITTDVYVVDFIVKEDSQKNLHWTLTVIGLSTKNILSPTTELYLRFYWKLEKDWFFDCGKQFLNCKRKKRVSLTCLVRLSIGKIVLVCKLTDCRIVYHAIL